MRTALQGSKGIKNVRRGTRHVCSARPASGNILKLQKDVLLWVKKRLGAGDGWFISEVIRKESSCSCLSGSQHLDAVKMILKSRWARAYVLERPKLVQNLLNNNNPEVAECARRTIGSA